MSVFGKKLSTFEFERKNIAGCCKQSFRFQFNIHKADPNTEDGRSMTTFLLLCKSSICFTEKHIFKIIVYFLNTLKCAANLRYMMVS